MESSLLSAKRIHLTGIKGVGMTAIALCLQDNGSQVSGSDVEHEFVTDITLKKRDIHPSIGFLPENVPQDTEILIYTGAHQGPNNPEVKHAQKMGIKTLSLAQATGELMAGKVGVSVCGVGGKTTTSAFTASIFELSDKNPSYLVGVASISSLAYPGKFVANSRYFIVEADEYASSPGVDHTPRFMHQSPHTIICTNIKHDHPDIYPDIDSTLVAYKNFFAKLPQDGVLIYNSDCENTAKLVGDVHANKISVGYNSDSTYRIDKITVENHQAIVTYSKDHHKTKITLAVPGEYNARNALMALACAEHYGIGMNEIQETCLKFHGVNRRFQLMGNKGGIFFYDDYAHHPSEVNHTLKAAKNWFPGKRIIVIFEPHTYSRTKVLMADFAKAFDFADKVIITDIFSSARETRDPLVTPELVVAQISQNHGDVQYVEKSNLVEYINQIIEAGDVLFTMGAGDVYEFHERYFQKYH